MRIFSGNANILLAQKISDYLRIELSSIESKRFSDGEIFIKILEDVRGRDVFVIQSTHPPAENLMELLLIIDALNRASAGRITAVIPYYGYGRQDKKDQPRVPISAKMVANLIVKSGANRILSLDLHSPQIAGFFDIPVDHLFAAPVTIKHLHSLGLHKNNPIIVSPDVGRVAVARAIAKRVEENVPIAVVDKRRPAPNQAEVLNVIGNVKDRIAIIIDDIIDTGGTLTEAVDAINDAGAKSVYAYITHPVLSGNSILKIESSSITKLIVTDSIPLGNKKCDKIDVVSVSELLGEAITRIHENQSISSLFI